jgi:hypothetical protein
MDIIECALRHRVALSDEFLEWLPENSHIYFIFEGHADALWDRGRKEYSSRTIGEKMRFDHTFYSNDEYKLRNSVTPYLGRMYVLRHPDRVGFFKYHTRDFDFPAYIKFCQSIGLI